MSYYRELGRIGLGSTFKKMSDILYQQTNEIYERVGIDMEASCFPLLRVIAERGPMSLRDAENELGQSHALISQKATTLVNKGYITRKTDKNDKRFKALALTPKGRELMERAKPLWQQIDRHIAKWLHPYEQEFFKVMRTLDDSIQKHPMTTILETHDQKPAVEVVLYDDRYKEDFGRLNNEWLDKQFDRVPLDDELFADPKAAFVDKGGQVFYGLYEGIPIGTCALKITSSGLELCKMGVDPRYRGLGVGRKVLERAIEWATEQGFESIILITHDKLESALHLYRKCGFVDVPITAEEMARYNNRCHLKMELDLVQARKACA